MKIFHLFFVMFKGEILGYTKLSRLWFQRFFKFHPDDSRNSIQFDKYFSNGLKPPISSVMNCLFVNTVYLSNIYHPCTIQNNKDS